MSLKPSQILRLCVIAGVILFTADCSNSNKDAAPEPTLTGLYSSVFSQSCVMCHKPSTAGASAGGSQLDFSSITTTYQTLQGLVTGQSTAGACSMVKIVSPGSSANSYIAAVLFADLDHANYGGQTGCSPYTVHHQDTNLSAEERSSLLAWINDGAKNN